MHLLYIAVFGSLGCLSRFLVSGWVYALIGKGLPYGTLAVNAIGSLFLGLIMEGGLRSALLPADLRMGIAAGFMGGFTTFSTFSYETLRLLEDGSLIAAGVNVLLNVLLSVAFAGFGIFLARQI
ncbi:MAG: camphor resistance protein CrcB [Desulfuromonadales bacterium C00003094]|nr:MAG: camphor resistance protein CrcB [Desulfuromonadales bacterium C00003094]OEU73552.1 MAG: camphor resistance protein CrcB [Desulfuromonadales bacterium C00003107]